MKEKAQALSQGNSPGSQGEGAFTDYHKPLPGSTIANNNPYDEDQKVEDGELKALMGATSVHRGGGSRGGEGNCVEAGGSDRGKVSGGEAIAEEDLEEEEERDQENKEQRLISSTTKKITIV